MRTFLKILGIAALIVLATVLYGVLEARRDPVVRQITLPFAEWPAGARPVRAVLISDVHIGSLTMGAGRLDRIVTQINALKPDIILIAGDFIAGHEAGPARAFAGDLTAALARLRAPLGVVAVLGNHDYGTDVATVRTALAKANVTVLMNDATKRGPLVIGGVDDAGHHHDDPARTMRAMAGYPGARIMMAHDPDLVRLMQMPSMQSLLPDHRPRVVLAGHTHCGQIAIPGLGPVLTLWDPRQTFFCGASVSGQDRMLVTSGLGTSILPIRLAAAPDLWLITFGPARSTR